MKLIDPKLNCDVVLLFVADAAPYIVKGISGIYRGNSI